MIMIRFRYLYFWLLRDFVKSIFFNKLRAPQSLRTAIVDDTVSEHDRSKVVQDQMTTGDCFGN